MGGAWCGPLGAPLAPACFPRPRVRPAPTCLGRGGRPARLARPLAILLELFLQLNDYEIRKGKKIGVTVSFNNHRLFVGNIPKNRDRDDLFEEFTRHARKSLSNS